MSVHAFVDAICAGEKLNYTSHTGILFYVNNKQIDWFSEWQNTVETYTFGGELTAARISLEKVRLLGTKLWWIGIPIYGPTYMFFDNKSVVKFTSRA